MSIRGEMVDFDKLQVMKDQILKKPKPEETKNRERFIDRKRRRNTKNSIEKLLSQNVPLDSVPALTPTAPNTENVTTPENEIVPPIVKTIKKK